MKPPPFAYHAPQSVDEACTLLGSLEDAKVLAGGQSLVPLLNFRLARPQHLVDINRVPGLDRIYERDGGVAVQALVRQAAVEDSDVVARVCPLLCDAIRLVAHRVIRNRGTVCGSLAHADPASELPAVLLALGGSVVARSTRGDRVIAADALFAELQGSQPQMLAWLKRNLSLMPPKAYRWVAEMHEIANFVGADPAAHELYLGAAHFYEQVAQDFAGERKQVDALKTFLGKVSNT